MRSLRTLFGFCLSLFLSAGASVAQPDPRGLYAWYRADSGLQSSGAAILAWEDRSALPAGKTLSRSLGSPRVWRVRTPSGPASVVRFNGLSALWQPVQDWGRIAQPRTVVLYARFLSKSEGVLLDGSTRSGSAPVVLRDQTPEWKVMRFDQSEGSLGGFILGADVSTHRAVQCDVAEVLVFPRILSMEEYAQTSAYLVEKWGGADDLPETEQLPDGAHFPGLDVRLLCKNGAGGVHTYRIPGLATSKAGTLLAVFDQRRAGSGDLPGDIDVGLLRSTDMGQTWEPMRSILDFDASEGGTRGNGVGDPCILVDRQTGRIFVAGLWSRGNRGWNGSGPGLSPEETGQLVLTSSDDDGVSWSAPVNITRQIKRPEWRLCFQGPGSGIQMRDGTLVIPAQFREAQGPPRSCFVFSADHGKSWSISDPAIPEERPTSESQIAELEDGSLLLTMRDESHSGKRAWCRYDWKTKKWGQPWLDLPDPTCQASLLALSDGLLLFCNPADPKVRRALTVRTSRDGGKTWGPGRVIDPGGSMYSCMTPLSDGRIGLLYEGAGGLHFARFYPEGTNLAAVAEGRFETTGKFGWWPERHQKKLRETRESQPDLVFLGDSITQNWEDAGARVWARYYKERNAANYGFRGDSTQHVLWRIEQGEFDGLHPKVFVLLIGTNNVRHGDFSPEQIAGGIAAVVGRLQKKCPASRVLLLGLFPRDADAQGPMRRKCLEVNALLPSLADGNRVAYLDVGGSLLGAGGELSERMAPDRLHLSAEGYQRWAEAMEPALSSLLSLPPLVP